jgi:hypothetical protein
VPEGGRGKGKRRIPTSGREHKLNNVKYTFIIYIY